MKAKWTKFQDKRMFGSEKSRLKLNFDFKLKIFIQRELYFTSLSFDPKSILYGDFYKSQFATP